MLAQKNQRLVIQGASQLHKANSNKSNVTAPSSSSTTSASLSARNSQVQAQPPVNSSFDDLVEAGIADASPQPTRSKHAKGRREGYQPNIPGRHPGPPGETKVGVGDDTTEEDPGSEISEPEVSSQSARVSLNPSAGRTPPSSNARKNGRANGKRVGVGVRISPRSDDDDDDEDEIEQQLKPLAKRRKGSVAPIRIVNSNFNQSSPTGNGGMEFDSEKGSSSSPTPSATSISSLIREKLGQVPIPGMFRNKKPKEYKLQAFVSILFLTIIVLVGSIYIIHKEKELQKSYFDRIRFSSKDRRIRVTNIQDRVVLSGVLGVNLNFRDKAWPCLIEHQRVNETCLEWMGKGRLYLKTRAPPPRGSLPGVNPSKNNILCYGIYWEGLSSQFTLKDCYDMGEQMFRGGFFYGGGETENDNWPLNKTVVPFTPFLTGNKVDGTEEGKFQWGHSLHRYFVNSEGAAIKITDDTPLYVSINSPQRKEICFGAGIDTFSFPQTAIKMPFLNYTICTAENALEISRRLGDKSIYERLRHEDVQLTYSVMESPIYKIRSELLHLGNQSDVALLNHTDKIASSKLPTNGFILLDETWQEKIGDLEGDTKRFPNLAETLNITKRRGFRIALTVQPFFSTQSANYVEGLEKGVWIRERARDTPFGHLQSAQDAPALTEYKRWNSVAVLDVTQEEARSWLRDKVRNMTRKYGIEAVYADMGTCFNLPQYYRYSEPLPSADHSKDLFLQTLRSIPHLSCIGVSTAVKLPKPPTFVSLTPIESSWKGLQSLIPNILSLGLAGFPFLNPGSIGGDFFVGGGNITSNKDANNIPLETEDDTVVNFPNNTDNNNETRAINVDSISNSSTSTTTNTTAPSISSLTTTGGNGSGSDSDDDNIITTTDVRTNNNININANIILPDRELYIRWLQLAHFLPIVQYSFLPNDYDDEVEKIAQHLEAERRQKIFSFLKKAMNDALTTGMPLIRPLFMLDPQDNNCLRVSDEFAIGEDIIVAPILQPNSTERDIYLPKGIWRDELEQSSTKGDRWLHNYKVKLNQIPYFIKLSDGSQFHSR